LLAVQAPEAPAAAPRVSALLLACAAVAWRGGVREVAPARDDTLLVPSGANGQDHPRVTARLFLDDPYLRSFEAVVVESASGACVLDRTAFHPGGGGQPHDRGALVVTGETLPVAAVREDEAGRIWHEVGRELSAGAAVRGELDWPYRHALMRHHALMHVVNTIARDRLGGLITGVQLGPDRSRIDLRLEGFTRDRLGELEVAVNEVLARDLPVLSSRISEEEFRQRPELVRTLNVLPPVVDGTVRIVEIVGFDAQACGGTHVHTTGEIGRARIERFDNKGKDNKRFYWTLEAA
jgi:misacylated tRNA(Ala) deacylase